MGCGTQAVAQYCCPSVKEQRGNELGKYRW